MKKTLLFACLFLGFNASAQNNIRFSEKLIDGMDVTVIEFRENENDSWQEIDDLLGTAEYRELSSFDDINKELKDYRIDAAVEIIMCSYMDDICYYVYQVTGGGEDYYVERFCNDWETGEEWTLTELVAGSTGEIGEQGRQ